MAEQSVVEDVADVTELSEDEMVKRLMSSGKYKITNIVSEPASVPVSIGRGNMLRDSIVKHSKTSTPVNKNPNLQLFDVPYQSHIEN